MPKVQTQNLIQMFESIGFSIVNKGGQFRTEFDLDIFQSSIEIAIADLQQIKRILLNSKIEIIIDKRGK